MLAVPCFAAEDSLSTVQNFVLNRDSGIVPILSLTGVSGMDDKTYTLTPFSKGWDSEWLYKWSNFTSPSDYFAFKTLISYVTIPVNMAVPLSETNTFYIPDFYFILSVAGSSFFLLSFKLPAPYSSHSVLPHSHPQRTHRSPADRLFCQRASSPNPPAKY